MPIRRRLAVLAVAVIAFVFHPRSLLACPVDSPTYLCEWARPELDLVEQDAAKETELRRSLARRPSADLHARLAAVLGTRVYRSQEARAAHEVHVAAWIESYPDDPRAHLAKLGRFQFGARDGDALRALAARFPDSVAVAEALVDHLLDLEGGEREARVHVEALVARRPDDPEAIHLLLELEYEGRRTGRAAELAARWLELAPGDPRALFHDLALNASRLDAVDIERRLDALFSSTTSFRLRNGACSSLAGEHEAACERRLLENWRVETSSSEERTRMTPLLAAANRWDDLRSILADTTTAEEADQLRRTIAWATDDACAMPRDLLEPFSDEARFEWIEECGSDEERLALVRAMLDGGAGDVDYWQLAALGPSPALDGELASRLDRDPSDARLWRIRADWAEESESGSEREIVEAWWRAAPDDLGAVDRLADLERREGNPRFAALLLEESFERSATCGRTSRARQFVDFELELGAHDAARRFAERLLGEGGELAELGRLALARAALAAGSPETALAEIRREPFEKSRRDVDEVELRALFALGFEDQVEQRLRRPGGPREPSDLDVGARALELGFPTLARASFRRAIEDDPGSPDAWLGLGRAERAAGDLRAAESALRRGLELRFDDQEANRELQELRGTAAAER
jgi:tetratricopeptide (TPR) repeat protein